MCDFHSYAEHFVLTDFGCPPFSQPVLWGGALLKLRQLFFSSILALFQNEFHGWIPRDAVCFPFKIGDITSIFKKRLFRPELQHFRVKMVVFGEKNDFFHAKASAMSFRWRAPCIVRISKKFERIFIRMLIFLRLGFACETKNSQKNAASDAQHAPMHPNFKRELIECIIHRPGRSKALHVCPGLQRKSSGSCRFWAKNSWFWLFLGASKLCGRDRSSLNATHHHCKPFGSSFENLRARRSNFAFQNMPPPTALAVLGVCIASQPACV